jgi:hypothetical protein
MAAAAESPAIRIRCRSHTRTRQGETTTCRFHTLSKMIIKAIFEDDLKLNDIENERYKRCMPLETPVTSKNNKPYSPFTCSKNGYIKIMLFYYFFYLAQQIDSSKINGPGIQALLAMPPLNPTVTEINEGSFAHLKPLAAKTPFFGYQIMLDTTELGNILEHVIIPILGLGFYLELGLVSTRAELPVGTDDSVDLDASDEEPERPSEHIVLIVGAEGDNVVIKNTWNDAENVIPFDGGIVLEKEYFKVYDLFFILPHNFGKYVYNSTDIEQVYGAIASIRPKGGKKRKTKYGQRRNHHKPKTIRASRKRTKTRYKRRLSKY